MLRVEGQRKQKLFNMNSMIDEHYKKQTLEIKFSIHIHVVKKIISETIPQKNKTFVQKSPVVFNFQG